MAALVARSRRSFTQRGAASLVAAGILLSRIAGLIRDRAFAHYLGNSAAADAFRAAFRIPNFLQNLFGEGVLSASFIPVYARLRAEKRDEEASRLAEAIGALLAVGTSLIVLLGILLAPVLIAAIAPGFKDDKRELTIAIVRILFAGAGLLVFSAWCLGILNSHRKFFLSYAAPVVWNAAIISTLIWKGPQLDSSQLAMAVAWGSVVGSALQFGVQLPVVLRLLSPLQAMWRSRSEHVNSVLTNFFPVFVSRGVVQISAYVDSLLASFLPTGAVAALSYAQTLYSLPVSLFGMAVSAAELPAMSSAMGSDEEIATTLRSRLENGLRQIAYFVVPSAVAFLILGNVVVATIYQSGVFTERDVRYVWTVLAGATVGLLASTSGRLYSSAFYALRDTRTPLRFAIARVSLGLMLGYLFALRAPGWLNFDRSWGVAGLTLASGIAGWVEFVLLRRALRTRIGAVGSQLGYVLKLWAIALVAAAVAFGIEHVVRVGHPVIRGIVVLGAYGLIYIAVTSALGIAGPLNRLRGRRA
jgi:putative peptidoglycan lipid II flippase